MSYSEFKNEILFNFHKDINFFYKIIGEFFELTNGFNIEFPYSKRYKNIGIVTWSNYEWSIN